MLNVLKKQLVNLDPLDVVKAELDSWDAYAYIDVPKWITVQVDRLSSQDQDEWYEWTDRLLESLQDLGLPGWKVNV